MTHLEGSYLERYPEPGGPAERIPLISLPFTIGRSETADHTIYSNKVSKEHAAIVAIGGHVAVRDLASTNGTFVNGRRIGEQILADGDIIHVAHVEFCFRHQPAVQVTSPIVEDAIEVTVIVPAESPDSMIRGTRLIRELIATEAVDVLFQPIVDLQSRRVVAYEALGRGAHPELDTSPVLLLRLAEQCGLAIELSQLFAKRAIESASRLPTRAKLFVNVHAREVADNALAGWLAELRALAPPQRKLVIEIAEASVTDVAAMAKHKAAFSKLGLEFAYDDFGAGQARLLELIDVPPNYLKLDKGVIQGIDRSAPRQEMVGALLKVIGGLGVQVIAEGIESEDVARTCERLGCQLGQGYLFGHPM